MKLTSAKGVPEIEMPTERVAETEYTTDGICRVLALDGGGAKGFYTLGVLKEIEGMLNCPLYKRFDIVFGTSTGAIIASLVALGYSVDEIHALYKAHVPAVMGESRPQARSAALAKLAHEVFGSQTFEDVKTGVGIVATRWLTERPMIFKGSVRQAHGRKGIPLFVGGSLQSAIGGGLSVPAPAFSRRSLECFLQSLLPRYPRSHPD